MPQKKNAGKTSRVNKSYKPSSYSYPSAFSNASMYALRQALPVIKYIASKKKAQAKTRTNVITVSRPKRTKPQYKTLGYSAGSFPKPKNRNVNQTFNRNGSVKQNEYGGTVSDAHALYIGHSTCASTEVAKSLCRAIIRKLFFMRGTDLNNWTDNIPNQGTLTWSLDFTYRKNPATTTALSSFNLALSGTFSDCADSLFTKLQADLVAGDIIEPQVIRLFTQNIGGGGGQYIVDAEMMCQQIQIEFDIHSKLTIQNTTLAGSGTTDPSDEDSENIENNPVKGYIYSQNSEWLNGFRYKNPTASGTLPVFIADDLSGAILAESDQLSITTLRKPPPVPWPFGAKKIAKITLQPGAIKVTKLHFNAKMNLATAFSKLSQIFAASTDVQIPFGNAMLLGFEKQLDSRSGSGRDVRLSYQIDQTIRSCLHYRAKNLSSTIVNA